MKSEQLHLKQIILNVQGRDIVSGGAGGMLHPPTEITREKTGKIMKQSGKKSGKKYANLRGIRDIAIRKIKI